jgi:Laminin G domain
MADATTPAENGAIGANVRTGVARGAERGYLFPGGAGGSTNAGNIVTLASSSTLNPGSRDFHVTVRVNLSAAAGVEDNLAQKGQSCPTCRLWKLELYDGIPKFYVKGSSTARSVTHTTAVNDGLTHTVVADKLGASLRLTVDGVAVAKSVRVGSVGNASAMTVGGKQNCNGGSVECDNYAGWMGYVLYSFG